MVWKLEFCGFGGFDCCFLICYDDLCDVGFVGVDVDVDLVVCCVMFVGV